MIVENSTPGAWVKQRSRHSLDGFDSEGTVEVMNMADLRDQESAIRCNFGEVDGHGTDRERGEKDGPEKRASLRAFE